MARRVEKCSTWDLVIAQGLGTGVSIAWACIFSQDLSGLDPFLWFARVHVIFDLTGGYLC